MTLKRQNGTLSPARITLLCTIMATVATCVLALPTGLIYCAKMIAPWTEMPQKIDAMQRDIKDIKTRLPYPQYSDNSTNLSPLAARNRRD